MFTVSILYLEYILSLLDGETVDCNQYGVLTRTGHEYGILAHCGGTTHSYNRNLFHLYVMT